MKNNSVSVNKFFRVNPSANNTNQNYNMPYYFQIAQEFKAIEDGHLDHKLQPEALRALSKRCKTCCEDFMRLLEKLDSFSFEEHQVCVTFFGLHIGLGPSAEMAFYQSTKIIKLKFEIIMINVIKV